MVNRPLPIRRTFRCCHTSAYSWMWGPTCRRTSSISPPVTDTTRSPAEDASRRLLRARDAMDRTYSQPLDIPALAQIAYVSEAHFIRTFRATFGETPHRYLQRRRVERAMFKLCETERSITDICFDVGFNSLGTFSRTFREVVGVSPSEYRERDEVKAVPSCFTMAYMRPSSFGEARSSNGT